MMDKKSEIKQAQETHQNVNEQLELTEEYLELMREKEDQLRKEGFSGSFLSLCIKISYK